MRRGRGLLVKPQATALVDVPTAPVFSSADQGVQRVCKFVRMLGHVLVRHPTVILTVATP